MWSSMNSMVATTMCPWEMSARQRSSAVPSRPQSAAACRQRSRPGSSRASVARARSTAPARWLSIVTITTRNGVASAGEVRFGIVERLDGDGREALRQGEALGVVAGLAADKERDLQQLGLRLRRPARRAGRGRGCRGGRPEVRGGGPVVELEVLAEHPEQVLLEAHHQRV